MLSRIYILTILFIFSTSLYAKNLIPIEHFSKHSTFHQIKLSPTGKYIAAEMTNQESKRIVVVINRITMKTTAILGFKGNEAPGYFFWLNDERFAVNVIQKFGSLDRPSPTGNVYAMNADGSKKKLIFGYKTKGGMLINPSIDVMRVLNLLPDDPKHIVISSIAVNKSSSKYTEALRLNVYSGKTRRLAKSPIPNGQFVADNSGEVRIVMGPVASENNKIVIYSRKKKGEDWVLTDSFYEDDGGLTPVSFSLDNQKVYMKKSSVNAPSKLYLYDLKSKQLTFVAGHDIVDINGIDKDRDGQVFAVHFEPNYSKVTVIDKTHPLGKWYPAMVAAFPNMQVKITSTTRDNELMTIRVRSDKQPGIFYLFNTKTKSMSELMKSKPWLDQSRLAQTDAFSFKSRDGLIIHGFITIPKGEENNLPMVVLPHGGPHGPRDYWTYDDDVQLLASRGYAVLKVNFRGSGGYGAKFQALGYRQWGGNIMNDITDATNWAIKEGIADKNRICIYGASFGGYASLMSVVKEPELYKCAIGYVGIYDMDLMFEKGDIADMKYGQNFLSKVLGDDKAQLDMFSPARHVDKIKADLFIVHGEKDIRAHYDHALLLKKSLDKAGKKYQWLTKKKEAHGFYKEENRKDLYQKMLTFLDKNIGH
ncbi:MAG: S9 family peptidase [Gammaproteobacteria bacterium]|nr:S9 family peptidase [Gammaproteobacteria bacterium]